MKIDDIMFDIAICDNDTAFIDELRDMLMDIGIKKQISMEIHVFHHRKAFMESLNHKNKVYDAIFIGIDIMKQFDGVEMATIIATRNESVMPLSIMMDESCSFDIGQEKPFRCLLKPLDAEMLERHFMNEYEQILRNTCCYEFRYKRICHKVPMDQIIYFESKKRIIYIHLSDGTLLYHYGKLDEIEESLSCSNCGFWRIHQSFLVNEKHIMASGKDYVELTGGKKFSISRNRRR